MPRNVAQQLAVYAVAFATQAWFCTLPANSAILDRRSSPGSPGPEWRPHWPRRTAPKDASGQPRFSLKYSVLRAVLRGCLFAAALGAYAQLLFIIAALARLRRRRIVQVFD